MNKIKLSIATLALTLAAAAQATLLDLGTNGSGTLSGALFQVNSQHPTGTGVFNPFLTVQNSPWEQGYNSAVGNFDTKREPQWNHEIRFRDLQITSINGTDYIGFQVDINEPNGGNQSLITLDALRIFTSATLQNSTSTDPNGFFNGSLGILRFDLGQGNVVRYNDQQSGSGSGDINIYVPLAFFAGTQLDDIVYMYQRWGNTNASQGGFEETSLIRGTPIPEMGSFFPILGLLAAVASTSILRRRRAAQMTA